GERFTIESLGVVGWGSGAGVDPAVLVPGDHDLLDVALCLVERDLLDEHLDVVAPARRPPLPHTIWPGIVGGQREARIIELSQETRQEAGAELDVERGVVEVTGRGPKPRRRRHELHGPARARRRHGAWVVARLLADDGGDQIGIELDVL